MLRAFRQNMVVTSVSIRTARTFLAGVNASGNCSRANMAHTRHFSARFEQVGGVLSSEYGTNKTVKPRYRLWFSDTTFQVVPSSLDSRARREQFKRREQLKLRYLQAVDAVLGHGLLLLRHPRLLRNHLLQAVPEFLDLLIRTVASYDGRG